MAPELSDPLNEFRATWRRRSPAVIRKTLLRLADEECGNQQVVTDEAIGIPCGETDQRTVGATVVGDRLAGLADGRRRRLSAEVRQFFRDSR